VGTAENLVANESATVVGSQSENTEVATDNLVTETNGQKGSTMQFQKVSTHKNGLTSYSVTGLRGSIYVGKGVFGDNPPADTLEISATGLVEPTAEQIARATKRAERKTRVQTSLAERAAKAQAKAEKAAANAAKLAARLAKQNAPAATGTPAEAPATEPAFAGVTE
jgi:hypothetical protein